MKFYRVIIYFKFFFDMIQHLKIINYDIQNLIIFQNILNNSKLIILFFGYDKDEHYYNSSW